MTPARLVSRIAVRQVLARKGLNSIAVLGVALGVTALVLMNAIMKGFQERFKDQIVRATAHVTVEQTRVRERPDILTTLFAMPMLANVRHPPPDDRTVHIARPWELVRTLRDLPGVAGTCGLVTGSLNAEFGTRQFDLGVRGVIPEDQDKCTPISEYVKTGTWRAFVDATESMAVGSKLAEQYSIHVGDSVRVLQRGASAQSVRVSAIFETGVFPVDRSALLHLQRARSLLAVHEPLTSIEVRLDDPFQADESARRIQRLTGYKASSWTERVASTLSVFKLQNMVVTFQIGALLTVGGFGILAIQIMIVLQKTRDISIMRSIGMRRRDVLAIFMMQGIFLAIVGAAVGDLIAWRLIELLDSLVDKSRAYSSDAVLYIYRDPQSYLTGLLFAVGVGGLASFIPAWRGSRVEPVDVLRGRLA